MDDYISRQKLLRDIEHYQVSDGKFQHWVEIQPSADVWPVRHGKWKHMRCSMYVCSECNAVYTALTSDDRCDADYCPYCGAKMERAKDDEVGG